MPPPDITDQLDFHDDSESLDYEEFLRSLLSLTMFTQNLESFGHAINALKKIEDLPGKTLQVSLSLHAGNVPMGISPELKALETLTSFNICSKRFVSQDECTYTITDPVGINFSICLSGILQEIGREHGGPIRLREVALRKGVQPAQYVFHLLRSRALAYKPHDESELKQDVGHLRYHFQVILDVIRAELTFYLIDDSDPQNWN